MTALIDDLRTAHVLLVRAASTTPPVPLPPAELTDILTFLAAVGRGLEDPVIGPRLVGLLAKVIADEEALTARERGLLPVVGA